MERNRKNMGSKKSGSDNNITLQDGDSGLKVENNKTADYLNKYFSTIGDKLQQQIEPLSTLEKQSLYSQQNINTNQTGSPSNTYFNFIPTIGRIQNHKNSGLKNISSFL